MGILPGCRVVLLSHTGTSQIVLGPPDSIHASPPRFQTADDLDSDQFEACVELDCDDTNPTANPGAAQICRAPADEDCDGAMDCEDDDCPCGPGPGNIADLHWQDGAPCHPGDWSADGTLRNVPTCD